MAVLFGLICGIVCGAALAFLVGFASQAPYLGWMYGLVVPTFVVGGLICGLYITHKADWMGI